MANESVATSDRVKIKSTITIEKYVRRSKEKSTDFDVDGCGENGDGLPDLAVFLIELVAVPVS